MLLMSGLACRAALVWEAAEQTQVVFANRPATIHQNIRNDADLPASQDVRLHLLQLSSSTAAPVPGWEVKKQLEIPARQTIRASVELSLPKVVSPTRFRLVWNGDAGAVLGSTDVVGCPEDAFVTMRYVASRQPIGLMGNSARLGAVLQAQGCLVKTLSSPEDLKSFRGQLVFMVQTRAENEPMQEFGRLAAQYAKEGGGRVVWLIESGNLPLSPEPAVCVFTHGQGTVVVAGGVALQELDKKPLDQLRLVWLAELALASEENRLLLLGRLMKL